MKYSIGVCAQLDRATSVAKIGADHIEPGFALTAGLEEEKFRLGLSCLKDSGLTADSMNSMLPGTAVLYGSEQDSEHVLELVRRGMDRAAQIGCKNVVFGSGTARNIPEGMEKSQAQNRLTALLERFCDIARPYGIRIAIEPLRAFETNYIHLVSEANEIAALLPHCENLGVNPDIYHMLEGNEPFDTMGKIGDRLFHVHICAPDRHYPRHDRPESDVDIYRDFFRALNAANYQGTVSIEGITSDMIVDLPTALTIIRAARDSI
ncbi:MAG: sugar phosphate isomerase/epimerase [Clostridia bacterium]|nr:sugar phosphate isomerase/epimerase [Clostridia bacterium]